MNSLNPSPSGRRQKNGSVELLRFLFTSVIIFFHINLDLWDQQKVIGLVGGAPVTFFMHGNIAVEFFFLVTGWLMAASVYRKIRGAGGSSAASPAGADSRQRATLWTRVLESLQDILGETAQFVGHKARAVLPYYLIACALTPLMRLVTDRSLTPVYFLKRLPSLLFLERLGLGKAFIGCTWYLSSMMLALCLAYPLCRRFYRFYTCFAGPVLACLLLWAMVAQTGSLGDIGDWFYITYKTNVRAFAEISIGAASFECSRLLSACFSGRGASGAGRDSSQESRAASGAGRDSSQESRGASGAGRDSSQENRAASGAGRDISPLALSSSAGRLTQENTVSSGRQSVREGFPVTFCRSLLSLAAVTGLALSVAYMCSAMDGTWALAVIGLLFASVTIVFSGEGLLCHAGLFRHPFFLYLGSISLPMYVSQTLLRRLVPFYFSKISQWAQCLMIYTGIILFAVLLQAVVPVLPRIPTLVRSRTGLTGRLHRLAFFRHRP